MTSTKVVGAGVQGGRLLAMHSSTLLHPCSAAALQVRFPWKTLNCTLGGAGTRERYKGTEHGLDNLVEKSKLDIVCFRLVGVLCRVGRPYHIARVPGRFRRLTLRSFGVAGIRSTQL